MSKKKAFLEEFERLLWSTEEAPKWARLASVLLPVIPEDFYEAFDTALWSSDKKLTIAFGGIKYIETHPVPDFPYITITGNYIRVVWGKDVILTDSNGRPLFIRKNNSYQGCEVIDDTQAIVDQIVLSVIHDL